MEGLTDEIVLVTGARSPAALDLARDLTTAGARVHMADSSPARLSRWSRAPVAVHRVRPPVQDRDGFRAAMAALIARLRPALVVPTCEEVFHLASARADGVDVGALLAPDPETLDVLHAKDRFNAMARGIGLDVPDTLLIEDDLPQGLDLAATVLKARYTRFGVGTLVAPTPDEAAAIRPTRARPWLAQRLVAGAEHSSYAIAVGGRVTAFAAYRSTMRLGGGAGYAFETAATPVSNRLLDATRRIARHLAVTGQISLDGIDDGERCHLIECNPRATSGVHLIAGDGRLAEALTGAGGMVRGRAEARHNLPMALVRGFGRRDPAARDVVGAPGDRLPLLGAVADTAAFAVRALRSRIPLTAATTHDIEWNGTDR